MNTPRILKQQRERRALRWRVDYYPSPEAAAIIAKLRRQVAGGDSAILNRIVCEWAALNSGIGNGTALLSGEG